jgi:hypothetical protein
MNTRCHIVRLTYKYICLIYLYSLFIATISEAQDPYDYSAFCTTDPIPAPDFGADTVQCVDAKGDTIYYIPINNLTEQPSTSLNTDKSKPIQVANEPLQIILDPTTQQQDLIPVSEIVMDDPGPRMNAIPLTYSIPSSPGQHDSLPGQDWSTPNTISQKYLVDREVSHPMQQVMTDCGEQNNTYIWNANFHLLVDGQACQTTVNIRLSTFNDKTLESRWESDTESRLNNKFKLMCTGIPQCSHGLPITIDVQFIDLLYYDRNKDMLKPLHYLINRGSYGYGDILTWNEYCGPHETLHIMGNKDEYCTVDGVKYGKGDVEDESAPLAKTPLGQPEAKNYSMIAAYVGMGCYVLPQ